MNALSFAQQHKPCPQYYVEQFIVVCFCCEMAISNYFVHKEKYVMSKHLVLVREANFQEKLPKGLLLL